MCLHGAASHMELFGDCIVIAALKQQFRNLLLPRAQSNGAFLHSGRPPQLFGFMPLAGQNFAHRSTQVRDAAWHSTHDYFNQLIYLPKIIAASLPSYSGISKKPSTGYPQHCRYPSSPFVARASRP